MLANHINCPPGTRSETVAPSALLSGNGVDNSPEVSVVVPLYNEAENVSALYRRLVDSLQRSTSTFELILVNDGSRDATSELLNEIQVSDSRVTVIHLSRNFGHQAAISAGIHHANGQAVVVMDGDLQDPPEVLDQFIHSWRGGYEVVYAVRTKRKENGLKRLAYFTFYRLLRAISDLDIPLDSGDFCLMDRKVVEVLRHLPEQLRFVRGLRTFVGFRQMGLAYERAARAAGNPKYSFRALVRLAMDGLFSFSSYPLRLITYLGLTLAACATLLLGWNLLDTISNQTMSCRWSSTVIIVLFMSALQLISLGIVGEYVRQIFLEVKGRPAYIIGDIRKETHDDDIRAVAPSTLCTDGNNFVNYYAGRNESHSSEPEA